MQIVCLSDSHGGGREDKLQVPDGDVLLYVGDYSMRGRVEETQAFSSWLAKQPHQNILVTFGNHELDAERNPSLHIQTIENCRKNVRVLFHEAFELNGVKFFGSPFSPWFHNWAFNVSRGPDIAAKWAKIPDDTEVLFVHGPCAGILDEVEVGFGTFDNVGCKDLRARVEQLPNLKLFVAGHLHLRGGQRQVVGRTTFINSAVCDEDYQPVNPIQVFEV